MKLRELIALINELKKDMSYTRSLQERWKKEQRRFPILFASIEKQVDFFNKQIATLFDAEIDDTSLSSFISERLTTLREGGGEQVKAVELQTLEEAAREAERLSKERKKEQAKNLAKRVKKAMESHLPKDAKSAEKVRKLGEELAEEIEKPPE